MPKVTFTVKVSGTDFQGVLHTVATGKNEKLKFQGTSQEGTCEKNLGAGNYAWTLITTGQGGDTFNGTVTGTTPAAKAIDGKIPQGKTHGGGMRPFTVVEAESASDEGLLSMIVDRARSIRGRGRKRPAKRSTKGTKRGGRKGGRR